MSNRLFAMISQLGGLLTFVLLATFAPGSGAAEKTPGTHLDDITSCLARLTSDARLRRPHDEWKPRRVRLEELLKIPITIAPRAHQELAALVRDDHEVSAALFSTDGRHISEVADVTDYARYAEPESAHVAHVDEVELQTLRLDLKSRGRQLLGMFHSHLARNPDESIVLSDVRRGSDTRRFELTDPGGGDVETFIQDWNNGRRNFVVIGHRLVNGDLLLKITIPIADLVMMPRRSASHGISLLKVVRPIPGRYHRVRAKVRWSAFWSSVSLYADLLSSYSVRPKGDPYADLHVFLEVPLVSRVSD